MALAERQLEESIQTQTVRTIVGVLPVNSRFVKLILTEVAYLARGPLVRSCELNAVTEALRQRGLHVMVLQGDIGHARDRHAIHLRKRPEQLTATNCGAGKETVV